MFSTAAGWDLLTCFNNVHREYLELVSKSGRGGMSSVEASCSWLEEEEEEITCAAEHRYNSLAEAGSCQR